MAPSGHGTHTHQGLFQPGGYRRIPAQPQSSARVSSRSDSVSLASAGSNTAAVSAGISSTPFNLRSISLHRRKRARVSR